MSNAAARKSFRLTGWHVLAMFVGFFAIVTAVDAAMVVGAYRTFPGEVTSQPYEEGLRYDAALDQQHRQAALGWKMAAGIGEAGVVTLTASDAAGAPLAGLRVVARLERPATEQGRRTLVFSERAPGVYQASAGALSGAWDLRLSAYDRPGRRFDAERRLAAP